jgi:cbb3-type cytochrome oxidase maturation protein
LEIIYWLIPIAIMLLAVAIAAFVWAVKSDQYSDLESPAYKILFDDDSDGNDVINPEKSPLDNNQNHDKRKGSSPTHSSASQSSTIDKHS